MHFFKRDSLPPLLFVLAAYRQRLFLISIIPDTTHLLRGITTAIKLLGQHKLVHILPASACGNALDGFVAAFDHRFQGGVFGQQQFWVFGQHGKGFFTGFFKDRHVAHYVNER